MKNKLLIFIFLSLILSVPFFVSAAPTLEIKYPDLPPSATGPTSPTTELAVYVRYLYVFVVAISGILALVMLILGGLEYTASTGSPQKLGEAKEKITSSIIGLVILACSALILGTIDPNFIELRNPKVRNFPPDLNSGVYLCKDRVYIRELWDALKKAKAQIASGGELSDLSLKEMVDYKSGIEKNCQWVINGETIQKEMEDKITVIYLVPIENEREYGVVLYEESAYQGKARVIYGNAKNDGKNANDRPYEWPVPGMKISSVRPFFLVYKPETTWYGELFYLVNYNRDNANAPSVKCKAENATEADCDLSKFVPPSEDRMCEPSPSPEASASLADLDPAIEAELDAEGNTNNTGTDSTKTDNDYKAPASSYGACPGIPKIASAKIEGNYFLVFFRDDIPEWTTEADIDIIIPNGDANNYDNLMGKWNDACKERTAEDPQGSRYPCATAAEIISGTFY